MNDTNTRSKILASAKRLFNEKGYEKVSLREIAEDAGTTIGNMTYYFPKKEHLLIALQDTFHITYAMEFVDDGNKENVLEDLIDSFFRAETLHANNEFYFKNMIYLCRDSEEMNNENITFRKKLYDYFYHYLVTLQKYGVLRENFEQSQYEFLAYNIVAMNTTWVHDKSSFYDPDLPHFLLADALCRLLRPYINEEYMATYDYMIQHCRRRANRKMS